MVDYLCDNIPLVAQGGNIIKDQGSLNILLHASTSNGAELMERNPYTNMGFSTLFEDYLTLQPCERGFIYSSNDLISLFRRHFDVVDIT